MQAAEAPASVSAVVGEAPQAPATVPRIELTGVHANEEGGSSGVAGTVHNDSSGVPARTGRLRDRPPRRAHRRGRAGGAAAEVAAHGSTPFQVLFIGSASGAQLEASAPPSTF